MSPTDLTTPLNVIISLSESESPQSPCN
ncbi:hypothetical protein [Pantoea sp. MT58]